MAERLTSELKKKIKKIEQLSVVKKALDFYLERLSSCGAFCYRTDRLEQDPNELFFLEPFNRCPTPTQLEEMKIPKCPFSQS
jgi:hypothetical protein